MTLDIGIIGLPNVGKSTLFNAITAGTAEASNYPFCTVEPNVGIVIVPDPRLENLRAIIQPDSTTPTTIRFVDIAGLVQGASKGEGMGNQFLSHIREADALVQVVRCFDNAGVSHVDGTIDPLRDIATIATELLMADLAVMEQAVPYLDKVVRSEPQSERKLELEVSTRVLAGLQRGAGVNELELGVDEIAVLASYRLMTAKPMLYAANIGDGAVDDEDQRLARLVERCGAEKVIAVAAQWEAELTGLTLEEREEFLAELGLENLGVERLIQAGYRLLDLINFYTLANRKLQAWPLPRGEKAPRAAGRIHTDMERGFIRAELAHCDQLLTAGGWTQLKAAGQLRTEGRDYAVADGDVITFLFKV
jgi:GTP-binding protein YchF